MTTLGIFALSTFAGSLLILLSRIARELALIAAALTLTTVRREEDRHAREQLAAALRPDDGA